MFTHAKKHKTLWRACAFVLSLAMILPSLGASTVQAASLSNVNTNVSSEEEVQKAGGGNTYVLDVSTDIAAFTAGEKADGDTIAAGTDNYFTAICSAKTKVDASDKMFDDGYTATHRFNMGGKSVIGDVTTNAIMFETGAAATVKIWWVSGGDGREMHIYKADGTSAADTAESSVKNSLYISELSVSEAGKYFLGSTDGSNYIFKVEVTEEVVETSSTYVLDVSVDIPAFAAGEKADGDTIAAGTDNFFTAICSAKTKVDASAKTFDDGYTATHRFNMGGKTVIGDVTTNAIMFETDSAATVKIWWVSGGDGREMHIYKADGTSAADTAESSVKNSLYISELSVSEAGKYFLGSMDGSNYIFKVEVTKEAVAPAKDYILDVSTDITAFAAGEKADGDTIAAGTENFFTAICSAKTKVDESAKTFDDGYTATHRFNMGGKTVIGDVTTNAIMFETGAAATVKIWWVSGGDGREMHIYKADGTSAADTAESSVKNSLYISELSLSEAGKYFLGSMDGSNYIFKVQVTVGGGSASKPPRADWSTVGLPAVVSAVAGEKNGTIDVTVAANVGYDGGDAVVITMLDAEGKEVASLKSIAEKEEHTRNFAPDASGTYTFTATLSREGEADKVATETKSFDFVLPLATPEFTGAQCLGGGSVELNWTAVPEAEKYIVTAEGTEVKTEATGTTAKLAGLEVDKVYTFSVVAVRGEDVSEKGTFEYEIVDEVQRLWSFAAYGTSTNTKDNTATGNVYDDNLVLMSQNGKGKVVPNSNDGLAFYYTVVDPETENFTISADITVTDWTPNSNQQAFGIMASDTIGTHGSTATVWNNSYMAIATKVEYYWDAAKQEVAASGAKYSMRMGVGALARTGVTAEDVAANVTMPANFKSDFDTLETSAPLAGLAAGNYNIVGNYKENASLTGNGSGAENIKELTTFHMELTRNNTGYIVSYTDENGKTMSELYYHADDGDELLRIDPENIYVGFFAARNATVEIKNVEFTTIHPSQDAPKEERPMDVVAGKYAIESSTMANSENYELVFYGNADGKLTITGPNGVVVENVDVTAETKYRTTAKIAEGLTTFKVSFTPNADYKPSEYEVMDSYETVNFSHTVNYDVNSGGIIYVSPGAPNSGDGTKVDPMSLNSALNHAKPGQGIYIMEGTYVINDKITVERGINGTAEDMIYFVADPEADTRPVFDFNKTGTGMTFAGDYWYLQGFDVTNTANGSKGLQISGDHCIVDRVNAYNNGNTGIQISRYKGTDTMEDWPSNNLILNCTSYRNADVGYNDADGFAAKLTVGAGNVFDGCIAAYNADDGWDLYAKVETGSIGKVTIQNSIAFKNGYDIDENGNEFTTGNGNGFKMGGESLAGGHTLINSIAFANRMKGIDSNSCPDIKVENCTSFNNASYNVAFYTNNAKNTAFAATGIVSYKDANAPVDEDDNKVVGENLKPVGTQVVADYLNETNFFFDGTKSTNSTNSAVVADDWFVSLDTQKAIYGQVQRATAGNDGRIFRNEDGTINMNGYLELTDVAKAATNAGAVINSTTGTKSLEITNDMFSNEVPNNRPEESGDSSGSSEPEAPVKDSVPDTGVENNNAVWLVVMLISGMGIAVSAFASRRKRSF